MPVLSPKVLSMFSALSLATTLLATSAYADAYKLYVVADTQSEHFVMGDDFGDYAFSSSLVLGHTNLCGTSYLDACYQVGNVFTGVTSYASTIPVATTDPHPIAGQANLPTGPGWDLEENLGYLFCGSYQSPGGSFEQGIWDGSNPVANYLGEGSIDGGFSSANSNVFYIDGVNNTLVVGIDLQTSPVPEPGTLSLVGTALATAATFGRRRHSR